jgi:hypothetical protein
MRTYIGCFVGTALGLVLVATPVLASDKDNYTASHSFRALEDIVAQKERNPLQPLSDDRLASIEGEGFCFGCRLLNVRINVSPIIQVGLVNQFNFAFGSNIFQENNAFIGNTIRFSRYSHY